MRNIGIMLTRNEEDVIEEVMDDHKQYFDTIFVLDGSTDRTPSILKRYKNIALLLNDADISPHGPITDGSRQFLIDEAQKRFGYEGYFTLLHGDEIFFDNPNTTAQKAIDEDIDYVLWQMMTFFPHVSEEACYEEKKHLPVQERMGWCTPNWVEVRQFVNRQGVGYDLAQHKTLVPRGVHTLKFNTNLPVFKHYSFRDPKQMKERVQDRMNNGFTTKDEWVLSQDSLFLAGLEDGEITLEFDKHSSEYALADKPLSNMHAKYQEIYAALEKQLIPYRDNPQIIDIIKNLITDLVDNTSVQTILIADLTKALQTHTSASS